MTARPFICDGHADTFQKVAFQGSDFLSKDSRDHLNLERLRRGGVNLQFMAIFTGRTASAAEALVRGLKVALAAHRVRERAQGALGMVADRRSLSRCRQDSRPHFLLTLEGADALGGDMDLLELFFRLGVRVVGLSHNHNSCAAGGCDPPDGRRLGLTPFGRELVAEMEHRGVLVDTAHLSRRAFEELLERVRRPVVNSHCCCAALVDMERNLTDEQLRALAATGGLAAVTYVGKFLRNDGAPATSEDVFRHLEHMVEVAGIDHVGLGSDFDGTPDLPQDLREPAGVTRLVVHMREAGWSSEDVARVLGGNWYRVLSQVLPEG